MLGTVVLALGHDPGRDVGNTHRRFGTVNVLTARAGRAINVNAQIRRVDFDINIIINFRINKRGAERRVATTAGVKRALTHQAVNASFCTQPAVSVIAGDFDRHGFNTRHFTFRLFDDFSFETTRFCPAQIHTLKHARPVLCFRTARPRLNIEVAVGAVIFAREHTAELKLRQFFFQGVEFSNGFVKGFFVVSFYSQFQQTRNIFQPLFHLVEGVDNGFEGGTLFTQRLCAFGFVPDIRLFQLGVYFFQTLFLGVVVKDPP